MSGEMDEKTTRKESKLKSLESYVFVSTFSKAGLNQPFLNAFYAAEIGKQNSFNISQLT